MKKTVENHTRPAGNSHKTLLIFVAVFLSAVLVLGAVLLTVTAVRSARAAVRYDTAVIDRGAAAYFASYYKYRYMADLNRAGIDAYDDPSFWAEEAEPGVTYGDLLTAGFRTYLGQVAVAAALYDRYASYGSAERAAVDAAVQEVLTYKADGSADAFNTLAAPYSFTYRDFRAAATLLYKATRSERVIYGTNGSNMINFPDLCDAYLAGYAHVYLLFIRTEEVFVTDEDGNRLQDENGQDMTRPMTAAERQERQERLATVREAIAAWENGGDMQMSPVAFREYITRFGEGDPSIADGYYFREQTAYTEAFSEGFAEVTEAALTMSVGEYREVACSIGVCFLYRAEPGQRAYAGADEPGFFSDFYQLAADASYREGLDALMPDVVYTDVLGALDICAIPYNGDLIVRF